MIYGAFPVCRNYTAKAHLCDAGAGERRGCENGIQYARPLRCRAYAAHLHPRHAADAAERGGKDGEFHGAGDVKK